MESPSLAIRTAVRRDIPAIADLAAEFAGYMRSLGDTSDLALNAEALERDGFGSNPAFEGLVAETSDGVVGFLLHHAGYDTDAAIRLLFVVDLYVVASRRGQGIGAALMRAAQQIARDRGARQLVWTVDRRNALGRRFYEAMGASVVETLDLMYVDVQARE